jgi:hypothetical protein
MPRDSERRDGRVGSREMEAGTKIAAQFLAGNQRDRGASESKQRQDQIRIRRKP